MSIPKEPRQLMINLMYLVLTALLALNVSAEIINAFFLIDKGIAGSNAVIDDSNTFAMTVLGKNAEQDKERYQPLVDAAKEIQTISKEFTTFIENYFLQSVKELKTKGIEVEPIRVDEITGKRFTFFKDPDHLPLEIYEI